VQGLAVLAGIVLLAASLLFSTLSVALREMSRARLEGQLERRGRASLIDRLFGRREELILAVATGRTLANIAVGFVVLWLFMIEGYPLTLTTFAASFGIAAGVVMIFGVALPHVWAEYAGESLIASVALGLLAIGVPFRPLAAMKEGLDNLVRRLSGQQPNPDEAIAEIEQEILDAVSEGEAQGHMAEDEKEMIVSVIELRDQHVAEIMTPRIEVVGVEVQSSLEDIKRLIAEQGYSRMPVYEESQDNILGILNTKDLLTLDAAQPFDIRQVMRKAIFVPDMKTVRDLLREFKKQKTKIAIVLDEYGGTAGVVTTTDIYEELVGDIEDEEDEPDEQPDIVKIDEATSEIDARVRVDEFNEEFDLELPDNEGYDTVGGFILSRLGRIPKVGDVLTIDGLQITVLDADERRISRVRVHIQRESGAAREQPTG
jgi:CBS domain containing-hemolysin-like protein